MAEKSYNLSLLDAEKYEQRTLTMETLGTTVIETLAFLLPGFISASIYYSLTPAPRPIPFERVVQALILTMLIQASLFGFQVALSSAGVSIDPLREWSSDVQLVWSVIVAIVLGVLLSWITNSDRVHSVLRELRVTNQTSYSSEWYGALCKNEGYIVLHLKGAMRLYGWPEEWPSVSDHGHFLMANAEWLLDDNRVELTGVERILIPAAEVEMVELMAILTESEIGDKNGR